jgi:hypothetical protein
MSAQGWETLGYVAFGGLLGFIVLLIWGRVMVLRDRRRYRR